MESMPDEPANDEAQLREELVAYLDGELDAEQSRRIEQRARVEPDTGRMLEELDRTWHMLDQLDAPATNEDFTCTTLEMVALAAVDDAAQAKAQQPRRRLRAALWAVAGLIAAAAAGFVIVANLIPDPNAQFLHDLPILENFDRYREIDNFDFLRALNDERIFPDDADALPAAGPAAVETPSQQRRRVEVMSAEQLDELFLNEQKFHDLSPDEQQRMRELHEQLESAKDREKLLATMNSYCKWLKTLPLIRHEKLADKRKTMTAQERVKMVKEFVPTELDPKDRKALVRWLDRYTADHGAGFVGMVPGGGNPNLPPDRQKRVARVTTLQRWQKSGAKGPMPIADPEMARLREGLSPALRAKLEAKAPAEQARMVSEWLRETASHELDEELADFFAGKSLDEYKRDDLMALPSDEMYKSLSDLYSNYLRESNPAEPPAGDRPGKKRGRGPNSGPGPNPGPGSGPGPRGSDAPRWPDNRDKKGPRGGKDFKGNPEPVAPEAKVEKSAPPDRPGIEKTSDKP
jgi:hypothetical protein